MEEKKEEQATGELPPAVEAAEGFLYENVKGEKISLSSGTFNAFQLAEIAAEFLKLKPLEKTKKSPAYTE